MKKLLILFIIGLGLAVGAKIFLSQKTTNQPLTDKATSEQVQSVSPEEFDRLAENPQAFVVDVHIPEQTHIPGTDAFIPYNEIDKNINNLPADKNTPILVYCRSGSMSREASEELISLGYRQVYDLAGGINAYREVRSAVVISPDTQDLGTVVYGKIAQTEFSLTNFTHTPLKITRVATSCGCTTAAVEKQELKPYEKTTVKVSFDPSVHKDDSDLGEVTRTIYIDTNNSNFAQLTAEITAKVIKKQEVIE